MKTKMLKSLSVCGLALSLFATGQTSAVHNFAHADGPAMAVRSGTIATGKVLLQGNNGKVSLVEEVSSEKSKSTVKFFLGNKQLSGFDKDANILAQGSDGVVLEEPTTHAIAIVQESQDGSALGAYTGVELAPFIQSIKDKAAQNKNIMYDHVDTKDFTVDNKKFTVPFLQTEISKIDGGVTVLKNGIGCSYTATTNGTNVVDNVGISMQKEVPSKYSIAKNNDVTVKYQGDSHTYTQNLLSFGSSAAESGNASSSSEKANSPVSDKQADKSTSASVSKSDDKAVTASVNSGDQTDIDTKAEKGATSSTSNGNKSSTKTDSVNDASSKLESQIASSELSSVKSDLISDKSNSAESKSESSSVSSSSEKLSEAEDGPDESGAADKVAGQSSSIASSQESSQLSSASSSKNGAGNGTDSRTTASGQTGSNNFEASGTNPGDSGNESGAITSAQPGGDDTYSAQKAAMLTKTNAKAAQSGIVSVIGAAIGTFAGWFGLKKKMIR